MLNFTPFNYYPLFKYMYSALDISYRNQHHYNHYWLLICSLILFLQNWQQCWWHSNKCRSSPRGTPQVFPVCDVQPMAHDQSVFGPHRVLHRIRGLCGLMPLTVFFHNQQTLSAVSALDSFIEQWDVCTQRDVCGQYYCFCGGTLPNEMIWEQHYE